MLKKYAFLKKKMKAKKLQNKKAIKLGCGVKKWHIFTQN